MFAASSSSSKVVPLVKAEGVTNIDLKPSSESLRGRDVCHCEGLQKARARVIAEKVNELFLEAYPGSENVTRGGDFRFEITNREIRVLSKSDGRVVMKITDETKAQKFIIAVNELHCAHETEEPVEYRSTTEGGNEREWAFSGGEGERSTDGSSFLREMDSSDFPNPLLSDSFSSRQGYGMTGESERFLDSREAASVVSGDRFIPWTRGVTSGASLITERKDEGSSEGLGEIRKKGEESLDDIVVEESEGEETDESSDPVAVLPDSESKVPDGENVVRSPELGSRDSKFWEDLLKTVEDTVIEEEESDETVLSFDISFPSNAPSFAAPMPYSSAKIDDQGKAKSMIPPASLPLSERASITMPSEKKRKNEKKPSVGEGESSQKSQGFFSGFTNPFRGFGSRKKPAVTEVPRESSTQPNEFVPQGRKLNRNEVKGVPRAEKVEEGLDNHGFGVGDSEL